MNESFYRAFEDRYRGSRELIKSRLTAYVPFVEPLARIFRPAAAIDLGCGRGEWLELLAEYGFEAFGVDLDQGMLAACHKRGLNVREVDAYKALLELPDESMSLVSAFHVVEHMSFGTVQSLIQEATRVLKPGGLLILETPNPENIVVGSSEFYLDPTHERPLPPQLLEFAVEHAGFERVKVLRLQEEPDLHEPRDIALIDVLKGVSPDYSVVAQKAAAAETLMAFDAPFLREYGLSLSTLAEQYDAQEKRHFVDATALLARARIQTEQLRQEMSESLSHIEDRLAASEQRARAAEEDLGRSIEELQAVMRSRSWHITAPMRAAGFAIRRGAGITRNAISHARPLARRIATAIVRRTVPVVKRVPVLLAIATYFYRKFPAVGAWLMRSAPAPSYGAAAGDAFDASALMQDAPSAWKSDVSLRGRFASTLSKELDQRQQRKP